MVDDCEKCATYRAHIETLRVAVAELEGTIAEAREARDRVPSGRPTTLVKIPFIDSMLLAVMRAATPVALGPKRHVRMWLLPVHRVAKSIYDRRRAHRASVALALP